MAEHNMNLDPLPFQAMKSGRKDIELRLLDQKRAAIRLQDTICFYLNSEHHDDITVTVVGLLYYPSFANLLEDVRMSHFRQRNKAQLLKRLRKYYSAEQERKLGVVGIKVQLQPS